MKDDVLMEDVEDIPPSKVDDDEDTTGTSIIELKIYCPTIEELKDPALFQNDQLYNDLSDTDSSIDSKSKQPLLYYSDKKINDKLDKDRPNLLSLDMKYRPCVVFNNQINFDACKAKYFLHDDTDDWLTKKKNAMESAINFKYDYDLFPKKVSKDLLHKVISEIIYNPVWDLGFRIGNHDKLKQNCCICPLSNIFKRCHLLFDTSMDIEEHIICGLNTKFPYEPHELIEHFKFKHDHLYHAVGQYIKILYANYWEEDVVHQAFYMIDRDLKAKYNVSMHYADKDKGKNPNGIVSTTRNYTRVEKAARLEILGPNPKEATRNLYKTRALNVFYSKKKTKETLGKRDVRNSTSFRKKRN